MYLTQRDGSVTLASRKMGLLKEISYSKSFASPDSRKKHPRELVVAGLRLHAGSAKITVLGGKPRMLVTYKEGDSVLFENLLTFDRAYRNLPQPEIVAIGHLPYVLSEINAKPSLQQA